MQLRPMLRRAKDDSTFPRLAHSSSAASRVFARPELMPVRCGHARFSSEIRNGTSMRKRTLSEHASEPMDLKPDDRGVAGSFAPAGYGAADRAHRSGGQSSVAPQARSCAL